MSESGEAKSYLVECYWPGVSEEKLALASQRARRPAHGLRRADVRAVSEEAGMPFERILESLRIDGRQRKERSET